MPHSQQHRGRRVALGGWPVLKVAGAALSPAPTAASAGCLAYPRPAAGRSRTA